MRKGRRCAEFLQETGHGFAPLALFEAIAAQLSPNPLVHTLEFKPTCREAVVGQPSHEKQVEFDDDLRETDTPAEIGDYDDLLSDRVAPIALCCDRGRVGIEVFTQRPLAEPFNRA